MFHNIGHEAEVDLKAMDLPAVEPGAASRGHHSSGANSDDDTQAEDAFAGGVAALLNKKALEGKFDKLLVIAAPKTLGELRKHWHKALEEKLVGEIAKDLAGQSTDQITRAIAAA
jgi:protein required for attachment to host cells